MAPTEAIPRTHLGRPAYTLSLPRGRRLELAGRPRVMGIVNLTPDSFSDGGRWADPQAAVEGALDLLAAGAEILDLGAESTRPGGGSTYGAGARTVPAEEELARLLPVLEPLRGATDVPLSVDTRKAAVARAALAAGADLVNDVSGLGDPEMGPLLAATGCPVVLMHSRGELSGMQREARYEDVVGEVVAETASLLDRARAAGIDASQVVLDPGLGFAKVGRQNLRLLRRLDAFHRLGRPLLVGASRKSFLGELSGRPPAERLAGSLAAAAWSALRGAAIVRVHDVGPTVELLRAWDAIATAGEEDEG